MTKLLSLILLTSALASGQTLASGQYGIPSLTVEQWRQDLAFFVNEITTKHRDPYHFTHKAEFDKHLAALIRDGHTFVDTSHLYARFPLEVFWFGNDLRVIRAAPEYKQALRENYCDRILPHT